MSQLLFLGTGAADWNINDKGDFFRRNSAALLNGELMLDCGSHIFDFAESTGNPALYDTVTDIIITHDHYDHFCRESVIRIADRQKIRVGCCGHIKNIIGNHHNICCVLGVAKRKNGKLLHHSPIGKSPHRH